MYVYTCTAQCHNKIPHMGTYCMYKQKSILTSVIVISRNVLEMMESFIFCL